MPGYLTSRRKYPSEVRYAYIDFELSHSFPRDTVLHDLRLPAWESLRGHEEYHPLDLTLTELEDETAIYDPFAFDVACLGSILRKDVQVNHHLRRSSDSTC